MVQAPVQVITNAIEMTEDEYLATLASPALPGFELPVADLWAALDG